MPRIPWIAEQQVLECDKKTVVARPGDTVGQFTHRRDADMPKDTGSPRVGALLAATVTVSCGILGLEAFSGDVNPRDSADPQY